MPDVDAAGPRCSVESNAMLNLITKRVGRICSLRHKSPILAAMIGLSVAAQTAPPPLSESVQRQALGPYRMILRSATLVNKPKAAPVTHAAPAPASGPAGSEQRASRQAAEPSLAPVPVTEPPVVAAVKAPEPAPEVTPPTPIAAVPKAVAVRSALFLIKKDPPVLSGSLAREPPVGVVRVALNVNPDGSTRDLKIVDSSNRRLNRVVLAAVAEWRYQPIDVMQATEVEVVFTVD